MKWIGALVVIIAGAWIGNELSKRFQQRPQQIRQLINALQLFEAEIRYSHSSIKDASIFLAKQLPAPVSNFFSKLTMLLEIETDSLFTCWDLAMEEWKEEHVLQQTELEIWRQFGKTVGQHDTQQQIKHIQLAITHLNRELAAAEEQQQRYGKMVRSLGFLTGLLIVLMLI